MPSISSVTETGVTWAKAVSYYLSGYYSVEIWYGTVASSAGTSVLFTFSSTSGYAAADICEYSGLASSPVDKTATNTGDSTSLDTGTTAPTSQANELFVGATVGYGATQSSPTNGFTLLDGAADTATSLAYLENIVSATGTADSGASLPAAHHWIGCIATFLISGSTPSPSPSPTPSPSPSPVSFTDGFESGSLSAWDGSVTTGHAIMTVESGINSASYVVYNGQYGLEMTGTTSGDSAVAYKHMQSSSSMYAACWQLLMVNPSGTIAFGAGLAYDNSADFIVKPIISTSSGNTYWGMRINVGGSNTNYLQSSPSNPTAGQFYYVETYIKVANSGYATLWVDGSMMLNVTGINTVANGNVNYGYIDLQLYDSESVTACLDTVTFNTTYIPYPAPPSSFSDNFQSGSLSAWDGYISNSGEQLNVQTSNTYNGASYSLHSLINAPYKGTGAGDSYVFKAVAPSTEYFYAGWVYFASFGDSTTLDRVLKMCGDNGGNSIACIGIEYVGGTPEWALHYRAGSSQTLYIVANATSLPKLDTWYFIECAGYVSSTKGFAEEWVNGVLTQNVTGLDNAPVGLISCIHAGQEGCNCQSHNGELYLDDIKLSSSYIPES